MNFDFITEEPQGGYRKRGVTEVTISEFFESEDNVGYVKLDNFKMLLAKLKQAPKLANQYKTFFNCANQQHGILGTVEKKTNRTNQKDYIHLNFKKGLMQGKATVYLFDNMEKFVNDYANSRITINFNWDALVEFCDNH